MSNLKQGKNDIARHVWNGLKVSCITQTAFEDEICHNCDNLEDVVLFIRSF